MYIRKLCFCGALFVAGCTPSGTKKSAVDALTHRLTIGEVAVTSRLFEREGRVDTLAVNDRVDGTLYFQVKIDKAGERIIAKEQILYLNFDMQQDFVLVRDRDTIPASFCQRIENGAGGSYEYMVAFEAPTATAGSYTLVYQDKIFGIGTIAFVYHNPITKS